MTENDGVDLFTLRKGHWYAYEMLPGYSDERYYSPILVDCVEPLKTGRNIVRVGFYNACYAEGVRGFQKDFRVLHRGASFMLMRIEGAEDRCAIVCPLTWGWLHAHFGPQFLQRAESIGLNRSTPIEMVVAKLFA